MKYFQEATLAKLSPTEISVISYMEEHPALISSMSISALSKATYVSVGAISRMARRAGFSSFRDLGLYIVKESVRLQTNMIDELDDTVVGVIKKIGAYNKHSIDTTVESLHPEEIEIICRLILGSRMVFTYGIGSSYYAAMHLEHNLSILDINARQIASIHDLILWTNLKHKDRTFVVLFSHTLKTKEILDVIELCDKYGIMTAIVTCNIGFEERNKLIKVRYNSYEGTDKSALKTFTSKTAQLYVVDVITALLSKDAKPKERISRKDLT